MFKLKKGNVIEKLNKMDRKQAYTYGGIAIAVVVALILLASFLGNAEDPSLDDFSSRGYDLATSPFITDEAEEYLLASKYPDMQENQMGVIYSPEEKEARQAEDALKAAAEDEEEPLDESNSQESASGSSSPRSSDSYSGSRGYSGRGGGGSRPKTEIRNMGTASLGRTSGTGVSNTWGPRVDNTSFKERNIDTGKNETQKVNTKPDAKRALSQFAQGSRAAAGLKDSRDLRLKQSVMGGKGPLNEDGTIDLSKVDPTQLDTNAPQNGTPDLNSLKDKVKEAADNAKEEEESKEEEKKEDWWAPLMDMGIKLAEGLFNDWFSDWRAGNQINSSTGKFIDGLQGMYDNGNGIIDLTGLNDRLKDYGIPPLTRSPNEEDWKNIRKTAQKYARTKGT